MKTISNEAFAILCEIIENENKDNYWENRFDTLNNKDNMIIRSCFKELSDSNLIHVQWGDNYPYYIQVMKDGYFYKSYIEEEKQKSKSKCEIELDELLKRYVTIKEPINAVQIGTEMSSFSRSSSEWMNDVQIFYDKYLKDHPLGKRINRLLFHRSHGAYNELVTCLTSIKKDKDFLNKMINSFESQSVSNHAYFYDVFLSHANKDKDSLVEQLYTSLVKLGISIFYDKESLEWGDNWKQRILEGTQKAEFAIIVISSNFFDREWTEKELNEFLSRQNRIGQKLILPILHNISFDDLRNKYPLVANIQAISSQDNSCDEIALLFARQLIKRLKANK